MDRYYTVMLIPEREKGVKSFRIPRFMFRSLAFLTFLLICLFFILGYDYIQILSQVYENKHLSIENRQLKEQIQLNQMKINSLSFQLRRIDTFEKKLRIISGVDSLKNRMRGLPIDGTSTHDPAEEDLRQVPLQENQSLKLDLDFNNFEQAPEYQELKQLYDQKIAANFGMSTGYKLTKEWSELMKRSFGLSDQFATFDFQFNKLKDVAKGIELKLHQLDQFLLDRESFIKSTPTLFPTRGWVTSYYGPRMSPHSGRLKMHEGIDIGAKPGSVVLSPADGIVTFSGHKPGFGNLVQVDHGYGIETYFGHNKKNLVKTGTKIKRGELIAQVGNTGRSTGPHLHYEVRVNGVAVDPLYYILE